MADAIEHMDDAAAQRRALQVTLNEGTLAWLAKLPDALRPKVLPARFPHMANALAARWDDMVALRGYLDALLIDDRGNRQGLPDTVAEELAGLKDYFETVLHPVPQTVWDEVASRKRE